MLVRETEVCSELPILTKAESELKMWQFGALLSQNLSQELAEACRVIKLSLCEAENPFSKIIKILQFDLLESFADKLKVIDKLLESTNKNDNKAQLINVDKDRLTRFTQFHSQRVTRMQKSQSLKATPSQPPSVAEVRFTQKTRSTFNSQRFEDLPSEVVFAEVLLLEIQQAVGILYGALVRFYLPVISLNDLEELREDLIETVTSNLVSGALADACLKLCRLSTR